KKKIREWGERIIDLDILLFGEQVIKTANLQIPHPQLSLRDFVLIPLQQVEPSLSIPGHDASLESLILSLPSRFVK
ncbi:MAG TPA: 2-amino-4-hydroxy-6-hydroxymethyldihydropteridine diphosphokinase, partial [Thiomicrospira sp.]|nr:2-amino-4-hydroxy-6-hydroxymethyldihydropteridine diphosphokinase [Thiomicrospira sp.]